MSNKLYYKLGLEELADPVEDTPVDDAGATEAVAEQHTDIQSDLGDIEKLQDDNETLQQVAVALENALKNGHPAESLTFIRQTIHRIDKRWGMHHRIASMENASSDADVIASMENAVLDGIKKTGQAIWEMLKRVWAKIKEWIQAIIRKVSAGFGKLKAKLTRAEELAKEIPNDEKEKIDIDLLVQSMGSEEVARQLEFFTMSDAGGLGGIDALKGIYTALEHGVKTMDVSIAALGHLYRSINGDEKETPEYLGEVVKKFVTSAYSRHVTGKDAPTAAQGLPDAWVIPPLLSVGYGFAVTNAEEYTNGDAPPMCPKVTVCKTNYHEVLTAGKVDIAAVAKRLIKTKPEDIAAIERVYKDITKHMESAYEDSMKNYIKNTQYLGEVQERAYQNSKGKDNVLWAKSDYLRKVLGQSGVSITAMFQSTYSYMNHVERMTFLYVTVMVQYWELVAKKTKPTE